MLQVAGTVGAAGLAGCTSNLSGSSGDDSSPDTITIGLTRSTTGNFVFDSRKAFRGLTLWKRKVNDSGGLEVNGEQKQVELVSYDDRSSRQRVTRLYETLITQDDVDVLFAPFASILSSAAAAVANKYDKFLMIWGAGDTAIFNQGYQNIVSVDNVTRTLPLGQLEVMSQYGGETLALLNSTNPFFTSYAKRVEAIASDYGLEVVHQEGFDPGTTDFTSSLQKINRKDPDIFFPLSQVRALVNIVRQMKSNDIMFDWSHLPYATNPQFFNTLGEDARYFFGWNNIHPKANRGVNRGLSTADFFSEYRSLFGGNDPSFNSANGYAAAVMIGECMKQAGTQRDTESLILAAREMSGDVTVVNGDFEIHPEKHYQTSTHYFVTQNQQVGGDTIYENIEVLGPEGAVEPTAEPMHPIPSWADR